MLLPLGTLRAWCSFWGWWVVEGSEVSPLLSPVGGQRVPGWCVMQAQSPSWGAGQWCSGRGIVAERLWAAERVTFPIGDFLLSLSAMPLERQGSSCWSVVLVLPVGAFSRGNPLMEWAHVGLLHNESFEYSVAVCLLWVIVGVRHMEDFLLISTHYEQWSERALKWTEKIR